MEYASTKPLKPSSNISDIVSKFAKVCKLRSVGVFASENPDHHHHHHQPNIPNNCNVHLGEDGSDATEETDCDGVKIHPQPVEATVTSNVSGDAELFKLFDIVSALKLAYVQLQKAHVPYNPKKIVAADEQFMVELEALCKLKHSYKEKQFMKPKFDSDIVKKVELNEKLLEELKFQMEVKNNDIICLQQELRDLDLVNATLGEKVRLISLQRKNNARVWNITTFQDAFRAASKSIHDFAKPLIGLMKASGWDLDLAVKAVEFEAAYSKRSHKKYAFEAYISRRMFYGIPLKSYNVDGIMKYDDPIDALLENPDSDFARFCRQKYLLVVHPMMEAWFFGHLDHRTLVMSGKHPRTSFYQIFARMAMWVWVLHGIAPSIDSEAKIFSVKRGSKFADVYMGTVDEEGDAAAASDEAQVEFMVMPGFRIGKSVVKSRVYISKTKM